MNRFSELPEPTSLEDTITSEDVEHAEPSTGQLIDEWLLKNAAG